MLAAVVVRRGLAACFGLFETRQPGRSAAREEEAKPVPASGQWLRSIGAGLDRNNRSTETNRRSSATKFG